MNYADFIAGKARSVSFGGIEYSDPNPRLFDHQRDLVRWALRKGRAAIFADTGLGKTAMQCEWARVVSQRGRVLILAPLAVAQQTVAEAARFGIAVTYLRKDDGASPIVITNYEMLDHFDPHAFSGVVLDESSILKAYTGSTRTAIIESFASTPFRLACTATPAPNDFTELGNHSEFLGVRTRTEMLAEFFVHDGGSTQDWRLKGHAETIFWRWVCSWAALVKSPADLGYDDAAYRLPALNMREIVIPVSHDSARDVGRLFLDDARTISEQRATRKATASARIDAAVEIAQGADPVLVWAEFNDEADAATRAINGAVQVRGSDSPEVKADRLLGFADGRYRALVTKPSIAGFGMNWAHCARMVFLGASHSYEQTYQAVRRCWRFGQTRPVDAWVIRAETEGAIVDNFRRKEADAERMSAEMRSVASEFVRAEVLGSSKREWNDYAPGERMVSPSWLRSDVP